ncbi:MAG: hypothetical protein ACPGPE_09665 [Planctomycetota bacterium]
MRQGCAEQTNPHVLLAVHLVFSLPAGTWLVVLLAGPVVHWLFNVLLWRRGFKARPA